MALAASSGKRDPLVGAAASIALVAAATLGGAWIFQYGFDIQPCPLCLEQRYAYYLAIVLGGLIALGAARGIAGVPRQVWMAGLLLIALAMTANAVLGAYHAGIEWGFWPGPAECSGTVADFSKPGSLLSRLDSIKVVRCDEVQWRLLGLSLAGYNVLISLALAVTAGIAAVRSRSA